MHILRPQRTTYVTAWQVGFFERVLKERRVHWARIFHDLIWVNASARWEGGLINHLTPCIVNFYRGMGLLTKEEENRFPKDCKILAIESRKETEEEDNVRTEMPPQSIARGLV